MTNLKDILSTISSIIIFLVGTYTSYVDSIPAGGSFNWKNFLIFFAMAVGVFLNGKNANGTTKTAAQVVAQADPGKTAIAPAFPTKIVAKVLVVILLLPALVGVSGCGMTAPVIISSVCTVADQICAVQSQLCALTPKFSAKNLTPVDSTALAAKQKFWTDSLYVLATKLQTATK